MEDSAERILRSLLAERGFLPVPEQAAGGEEFLRLLVERALSPDAVALPEGMERALAGIFEAAALAAPPAGGEDRKTLHPDEPCVTLR